MAIAAKRSPQSPRWIVRRRGDRKEACRSPLSSSRLRVKPKSRQRIAGIWYYMRANRPKTIDLRGTHGYGDRKSVVTGKGGSVRVYLGGRRYLKTKKTEKAF